MKTYKPFVSVVIPTFQRATVVQRAIRSVQAQSVNAWELIIVDDASHDETEKVVRAIGDRRITYIRHQQQQGASAARNTGIERAAGEFVAMLDSDDTWLPRKLQDQLTAYNCSEFKQVGLIYGGIHVERRGGRVITYMPKHRGDVTRYLAHDELIPGKGILPLIPRAVLDDVGGFDPSMLTREDHDLWLRIAYKYAIDYTPTPIAEAYKAGEGNLCSDPRKVINGIEKLMDKHHDLIRESGAEALWLGRLARQHHIVGERAKALQFGANTLRKDWKHAGAYLRTLSYLVPYRTYAAIQEMRRGGD